MESEDDLDLTASQKEAIEELRSNMSGEMEDVFKMYDQTYMFYRFLKARGWDVCKAEQMLRKCLKWRRENDHVVRDYKPTPFLKKYFNNFHIGNDKEDCPVFYIPSGKYDVKGLHMAAKYNDIEKTVLQLFSFHENALEQRLKKSNKGPTKFVVIFNETGQTFANSVNKNGMETIIRLGKVQQDNFPERLKAVIFINAPNFVSFTYNLAKSILSSDTMAKIHVYGTDGGWKEELLKMIDADQLPAFLGGTRTDPDGDPLCKTFLNQGGKVDQSDYIHKSVNALSNVPGVEKIQITRSSSVRIPVGIQDSGSVIEWQFELKSGDIGFGLIWKDGGLAESELVVPLQRLDTKNFSESGMYKCEKAGKYFLLFDNSHSWFRSKELFYKFKVLKSNEFRNLVEE